MTTITLPRATAQAALDSLRLHVPDYMQERPHLAIDGLSAALEQPQAEQWPERCASAPGCACFDKQGKQLVSCVRKRLDQPQADTAPVPQGLRVQEIALTDAQRKLLTVTGDVHIPGAAPSESAQPDALALLREARDALSDCERDGCGLWASLIYKLDAALKGTKE